MSRVLAFLYSMICYMLFLGTFLYAVGFVGNLFVPKSIDSGPSTGLGLALLINALLLAAFAIQHTIMARPGFKKLWTKIVPKSVERSTFVLFTNCILILMYWQWRPMSADIWVVESLVGKVALTALFGVGWLIVLLSTFMINHFDLFGLRQTWLPLIGKPLTPPHFQTTGFYKIVRHPIMFGFVVAFWATPHMTLGHLFFSIMTTGYILVGIWFEERDLIADLGENYLKYRREVSKLIPWFPKKSAEAKVTVGDSVREQPDAT
ncbi:MAG: isoprenylcysteine carboxylmethyltransferase family protein [candidate division Zixibacteria bacterium]|nr:isoprenylcysteine carboxylmethyltransferase family protein [candidate division Zixibacteria bacterium]MDH3936639.1 isoprenylcysteine carboxylmethyltransferase family protein [candidate division Zixibacteria bacterium]MDH4034184.1 isoprenylcysteine carboxylmethyltransferase family protein [candidate division Zixibacteria bacterium]